MAEVCPVTEARTYTCETVVLTLSWCMHIVDERQGNVAREISLLRKLGASRRFKSLQLFRDRQLREGSEAENVSIVGVRSFQRAAA